MRMSRLFGHTLRDPPAEAETPSHRLLLRAGFIDQLMAGAYSYLPLGQRTKRKVEQIVREEMDATGAQEVLLPAIQPRELWEKSGRDRIMDEVLFQFLDRRHRPLVLGATHEEVVTALFGDHAFSYRDLPAILYQIQTKFRDEARPRAGLQRLREFTMKDAYSFDLDDAGLDSSYGEMFGAYRRTFRRCGVPTIPVEADSGAIGGKGSQEFVFLTEIGEDTVVVCDRCDYAANTEQAEFLRESSDAEDLLDVDEVETPGVTTIDALTDFLAIGANRIAKAVFYTARDQIGEGVGEPFFVVIRGDLKVNEIKLGNVLGGRSIEPMTDAELEELGIISGYASPVETDGTMRIITDLSILSSPNLVAGANRYGVHLLNVNYGRDWEAEIVADIALAEDSHQCGRCDGGTLRTERGIEMGHVFRLGRTYSEPLNASVLGDDGESHTPVMGCYGIGIDRIISASVEAHHDELGIRWPASIAPYDVYLVGLGLDRDLDVAREAELLYLELQSVGVEVLFDDRDESPGVKFNDADLIGVPLRVTVSSRNRESGMVEIQRRGSQEPEQTLRASVLGRLIEIRDQSIAELNAF